MLAIVKSMALKGLDGYLVSIQVDISNGMPCFDIVGLPDISVKEAKERVKTAIKNTGIHLNSKKIVINLAPANTRKEGSKFDLPIALGILIASGEITNKYLNQFLEDTIFIGELSLNGKVEKVNGILSSIIEAKKLGILRVVIPKENAKEASIIEGIEVLPISHLSEIIEYLNGDGYIEKLQTQIIDLKNKSLYQFDFSEVKGQENAKRALEIAAAGGHNCILIGCPGTGKTMLAQRIPSILPDITMEEALEVTKIYSVTGMISKENPLITNRPFRSPHHNITATSLVGGGKIPKPGEISLAHYGVLFLDEILEFNRNVLETLRGPLEDKKITISRLHTSITYPCNFILIASMNPCPCGYYGAKNKQCTCTPEQIKKYLNKISGPLLDRIDLHIEVHNIEYNNLKKNTAEENSSTIRERVNKARTIQLERYKKYNIYSNSELETNMIQKYCEIDGKSKEILENAFEKLGLSVRAYNKILKVARTIADLDMAEKITLHHITEAIQYRSLDRKYWR